MDPKIELLTAKQTKNDAAKIKVLFLIHEGLGLFLGILGYKEFSRELVFVMVWC